jgi:hypothetical protein
VFRDSGLCLKATCLTLWPCEQVTSPYLGDQFARTGRVRFGGILLDLTARSNRVDTRKICDNEDASTHVIMRTISPERFYIELYAAASYCVYQTLPLRRYNPHSDKCIPSTKKTMLTCAQSARVSRDQREDQKSPRIVRVWTGGACG